MTMVLTFFLVKVEGAQPKFKSGGKIDIVGIPPVNKIRDWMKTVPSF